MNPNRVIFAFMNPLLVYLNLQWAMNPPPIIEGATAITFQPFNPMVLFYIAFAIIFATLECLYATDFIRWILRKAATSGEGQ